jgi:hypothetical protein
MGPQARVAARAVVSLSSLNTIHPHGTIHSHTQAHLTPAVRHQALFDANSVSVQFTVFDGESQVQTRGGAVIGYSELSLVLGS